MEKILTVQELNEALKTLIENKQEFKDIYVQGELSNLTFNKSGHIYFSIKEQDAAINCMMWKTNAYKIQSLNLEDGMQIICYGRLTYYIPTGRVSFEVRDIQIHGIGDLQKIFEQRYKELEQKGWFDPNLKKSIPEFVKNVGIITADSGAAIYDLIRTVHRRLPLINIYLFPAQVQGDKAEIDITNKIKQANNFKIDLDVLIVGRGGGSYEDLWAFNELEVLQAIKNSHIPIISAVGHEPDWVLSDYVADIRAATPTAAGELVSKSIIEIKNQLKHYYQNYKTLILNKLDFFNEKINNYKKDQTKYIKDNFSFKYLQLKQLSIDNTKWTKNKIDSVIYKLEDYKHSINNSIIHIINSQNKALKNYLIADEQKILNYLKKQISEFNYTISSFKGHINQILKYEELSFDTLENKLNSLDPLKPLQNGYSIVTNLNHQKIRSYKQVKLNEDLKVILTDSKLTVTIKEVKINEQ
ncbi:exodeoxyribonuclease VII large subunit [Mycoplasma mycoides subsp. mycoides]|uniref:exodeoxyribonuclease VII large subunit n=1 Tax=Mycoplasma mycoides TaxID=2102 RepID=UPI00076846FC|nr:exodeoxyribonuclease VII large subunit [Mycoplasma mycoides]AME10307.1 exodeoxyribonuclease VII large subunit [Mycoplasma mycoides subsp. mycoides]AME11318.1 exodeoxyribonuclease VII large subunit [Mycoplasma mycoides subsp. mycoides]AME12334.1 exodeoxyribonuclease VII large subunit [Mycoplasma mycoides subsp. mycoides]AME13379.1 exodeoxyribonuclease VII large subunit [Mycoplasma mycoides subsp. mycoides]AME14362.1 exodeoxyribonuclease VII large subunit [Mycoplasma mycoides subsp. mycoides]